MKHRRVRVLLVDDHPIMLAGVQARLKSYDSVQIIGEASTGKEALKLTAELDPDVVLMDLKMPEMDGLMATKALLKKHPKVKVLIFTVNESPDSVMEVLQSGASGYVLKDSKPNELVQAIEAVYQHQAFFSAKVSQILLETRLIERKSQSSNNPLSARECNVLSLIAKGLRNKDIAQQLDLSVRTVESYRENIMKKLHIDSVAGLTKYAVSVGLVELNSRV
jgi:two-component system, NarL family, nitrate/nitrite response regulator NarL